jgi:hypothetical protein
LVNKFGVKDRHIFNIYIVIPKRINTSSIHDMIPKGNLKM